MLITHAKWQVNEVQFKCTLIDEKDTKTKQKKQMGFAREPGKISAIAYSHNIPWKFIITYFTMFHMQFSIPNKPNQFNVCLL